jgi:hypothetical protein
LIGEENFSTDALEDGGISGFGRIKNTLRARMIPVNTK